MANLTDADLMPLPETRDWPGFPARFDDARAYRYVLWRYWGQSRQFPNSGAFVMFIGLNPSTADETQDDPTIRRCIAFAKSWGYSGLCMTNLFAYRLTDSAQLKNIAKPKGTDTDYWLDLCARKAGLIIAAWGTKGNLHNRGYEVKRRLKSGHAEKLHYLSKTKHGFPEHPLYLKADLQPILWN